MNPYSLYPTILDINTTELLDYNYIVQNYLRLMIIL